MDFSKKTSSEALFKTALEKIPQELINQRRFFPCNREKQPCIAAWQKQENQMTAQEAAKTTGIIGMNICGEKDLLFIDFDKVVDEAGNFLYADAEKWFNYLIFSGVYCERSISGAGYHFFVIPNRGVLPKLTGGNNCSIFFDDSNHDSKIELFYLQNRYCVLTGAILDVTPAALFTGSAADEIAFNLYSAIQGAAQVDAKHEAKASNCNFNVDEARAMLDSIPAARSKTSYGDWWRIGAILFDSFGDAGFELWREWSAKDKERYDFSRLKEDWQRIKKRADLPVQHATIGSLYFEAKKYGYKPPKRKDEYILKLENEIETASAALEGEKQKLANFATELEDAKAFICAFKATDVTSRQFIIDNLRKIAWLYMTCDDDSVEEFFHIVKSARNDAKERLKDKGAPIDDKERADLERLIDVDLPNLKRRVKSVARDIEEEQQKTKIRANGFEREIKDCQNKIKEQTELKARKEKAEESRISDEEELKKMHAEYQQNPNKELADAIRKKILSLCEWKYDKFGKPVNVKANAHNAKMIFEYDPLLDKLFGHDDFQENIAFLKCPHWRYDKNFSYKEQTCIGSAWTDSDDCELRRYLFETYGDFKNKEVVYDYVVSFANKNRYHEVKEFFYKLPKWDGKPRMETFFIDWLKVDDTPFAREVTKKALVAAIARIFHAGCNYQLCVILHGNQGCGKSYTLERLGGKWYAALTDSVDDPHAYDALQIGWIFEFKELRALKKADQNAIKQFVEIAQDKRRKPYDRRPTVSPRHCVFFGTTNEDNIFGDVTGNRRFAVLDSNLPTNGYVHSVRGEKLTDDSTIYQLWAEVYDYYQKLFEDGFDARKLELSREAKMIVEETAEKYTATLGVEADVKEFVDRKILPPIVWNLMSREERQKFFANNKFELEQVDIEKRFENSARRISDRRRADFLAAIAPNGKSVISTDIRNRLTGEITVGLKFFGSYARQTVCAAEICCELYGHDRRNLNLIQSILAHKLDGWTPGKRIKNYPQYGDQKKVYYRDAENNTSSADDVISDPDYDIPDD